MTEEEYYKLLKSLSWKARLIIRIQSYLTVLLSDYLEPFNLIPVFALYDTSVKKEKKKKEIIQ